MKLKAALVALVVSWAGVGWSQDVPLDLVGARLHFGMSLEEVRRLCPGTTAASENPAMVSVVLGRTCRHALMPNGQVIVQFVQGRMDLGIAMVTASTKLPGDGIAKALELHKTAGGDACSELGQAVEVSGRIAGCKTPAVSVLAEFLHGEWVWAGNTLVVFISAGSDLILNLKPAAKTKRRPHDAGEDTALLPAPEVEYQRVVHDDDTITQVPVVEGADGLEFPCPDDGDEGAPAPPVGTLDEEFSAISHVGPFHQEPLDDWGLKDRGKQPARTQPLSANEMACKLLLLAGRFEEAAPHCARWDGKGAKGPTPGGRPTLPPRTAAPSLPLSADDSTKPPLSAFIMLSARLKVEGKQVEAMEVMRVAVAAYPHEPDPHRNLCEGLPSLGSSRDTLAEALTACRNWRHREEDPKARARAETHINLLEQRFR